MGTDVHPAFQRKVLGSTPAEDSWEYITDHKYEGNRHYFLFGWLANVRNGYGFGGTDTGDSIKPLAEPRGLPEDLVKREEPKSRWDWKAPDWEEYYKCGGSFGDHSFSWLTSTEILEGTKHFNPVHKRGVLTMDQYVKWDKVSQPESWCGGIWGGKQITIDQSELTPEKIRSQSYAMHILNEVDEAQKKIRWVRRHVKKMVPDHPDYQHDSWSILDRPGNFRHVPKVEKIVRQRVVKRKKSALKHLAKLRRYAGRVEKLNIRCQWTLDNAAINKEFAYFTDEVKRLHEKYGEVRMVFGFDS